MTGPAGVGHAVVLEEVRTGYGETERLHGISLELAAGIHLLIGANGSGKTTLLRAIAGVLPLWSGSVRFTAAVAHQLGYVAHRPALSPRLTVAGDLEFWGRALGMTAHRRQDRSAEVSKLLGLEPLLGQTISELSRGQSQRVAIAKALLADPAVLLLDEPLSGVDPQTAQRLRDDLRGLAERGRTIVISSHELAELSGMGADVIALSGGSLVAHASTDELLADTGTEWMRLRAGEGAQGRLAALQIPTRQSGEGLEIRVSGRTHAAQVVRDLVGMGIDVYELSPVRNELTQIFLQLQKDNGDHP